LLASPFPSTAKTTTKLFTTPRVNQYNMATLQCVMCDTSTNIICVVCKSANYCSTKCQDIDRPLHNLLCTKLEAFKAANPRPGDDELSTYTLGILFPESEDNPELIWVKSQATLNGQSWTNGCDLSEYSDDFENIDLSEVRKVCRMNGKDEGLEVWPCSTGWDDNECLNDLLYGPSDLNLDSDYSGLLCERVGCSCVVVRYTSIEIAPCKQYVDISLGDLRLALNSFCRDWFDDKDVRGLENNPYGEESFAVLTSAMNKTEWVKGVVISCNGEMRGRQNMKKFRLAYLRKDDAIFEKDIDISSIADHLGFPVVLQSIPVGPIREEDESYENPEALIILLGASLSKDTWNVADMSQEEDIDGISSVLVVRRDQQDITPHQVEALSAYCSNVLQSAMTAPEGEKYDRYIKQAIIETYMTYEKFCEFFQRYKAQKLATGHTDWLEATPPRCVDTGNVLSGPLCRSLLIYLKLRMSCRERYTKVIGFYQVQVEQ
jgi:hypothetical protein